MRTREQIINARSAGSLNEHLSLEVLLDIRDLLIEQRDERGGNPYDDLPRHREIKRNVETGNNKAMESFLEENPDLAKKLNPEAGIMKGAEEWEGRDE